MESIPWGLVDIARIVAGSEPGDAAMTAIAAEQMSLLSTPQLAYAGIGRHAIAGRMRRGLLSRLHHGIYMLGAGEPTDRVRIGSGLLAAGPGSLASHLAGAFVWDMVDALPGPVDITVPHGARRSRLGIRTHRTLIHRSDRRRKELLPVTSPARTILDVGAISGQKAAEHCLNEARMSRIVARRDFIALHRRTKGARGWATLIPLLREDITDDFSRSKAETALKRLIGAAGLPRPRRNFRVHGIEVDFWWPDLELNVEMDGYTWHSTRDRSNNDRERDTLLASKGILVIRFSRDQLRFRPETVIARLAAAIALRSRER